jgi:hypothetical protein
MLHWIYSITDSWVFIISSKNTNKISIKHTFHIATVKIGEVGGYSNGQGQEADGWVDTTKTKKKDYAKKFNYFMPE